MDKPRILIIGGGLAGLSAGCYALRNGFDATIIEHNAALGGVCTAWQRGDYLIDGCIHWLTGGPYQRLYEELGILPRVRLRTLEAWATYRDVRDGIEVRFERNLDAFIRRLKQIAPEDGAELDRMRKGAADFMAMKPSLAPQELLHVRDALRSFWELRGSASTMLHYRKPIGVWAREHLQSPHLQRMFTCVLPPSAPALFLLMVLGYLERGYLSRPIGGSAAFRDALERSYRAAGGEVMLNTSVDEVLVSDGRVTGLQLSDGTQLSAAIAISTASAPETVLRLLGGRFDAKATRERLEHWQLVDPIVLASFGAAQPYAELPALWMLDRVEPFEVGGRINDHLYLRVGNDDSSLAPPGHSVVQALLATDYAWWATRRARYQAEKEALGSVILTELEPYFPGLRSSVRVTDIATPLTFWNKARAYRGAYEGWIPSSDALFTHIDKRLHGLQGLYMAGQWVEPGGGVPTAVASGRQVVELICRERDRQFVAEPARHEVQ